MATAQPPVSDLSNATIGILGGSGLYAMEELRDVEELEVPTPFGQPSDRLIRGNLDGTTVIFLARHGRHHSYLPSEVPYRANIWAMRSLGVRWILSCSAVGSLQEQHRPLDLVIPDQFIDRPKGVQPAFLAKEPWPMWLLLIPFAKPFLDSWPMLRNRCCRKGAGCTSAALTSACKDLPSPPRLNLSCTAAGAAM